MENEIDNISDKITRIEEEIENDNEIKDLGVLSIDRLIAIGNKFLDIAEKENLAGATKAFGLAERAFKLAIQCKKEMTVVPTRPFSEFIVGLSSGIERQTVWKSYIDYCSNKELMPLGRNDFYRELERHGCKFSKINGEYKFFLPAKLLK